MTADPADFPGPRNPLFGPSPLSYELPPFASITLDTLREGLELGMAARRDEVSRVKAQQPITFDNTLVALERSGAVLERVESVLWLLASADTSPELQEIETAYAPVLAAFSDELMLDEEIFARIDDLHTRVDELGLDAEERRLLQRYHDDFVRAGAALPAAAQRRMAAINTELAELSTEFGRRLLADTNDAAVHVNEVAELAGLSVDAIAAAREAAAAREKDGYLLTLVLPTHQPALEVLTHRPLRQRLWEASVTRGARGNAYDTRDLLRGIVALRAERAGLLGFGTHADYVLADRMAHSTSELDVMLDQLYPPAAANARAEQHQLAAMMRAATGEEDFAAWDWSFYAEALRREQHAPDAAALRPYFELTRTLEQGVFYAAERLYGVTFARRPELVGYHPDAVVYEVFDADGSGLGLFVGDYFTRDSKRGGAWMESIVRPSGLWGRRAVVVNNLNVPKPPPGSPALLSVDEVDTMFHEFGHALHSLFSTARFPRLSATSVARDFVEYPSQVNEMWRTDPEVLANYARHHETGEPLPAALAATLEQGGTSNQGFLTAALLAASAIDLAWHRLEQDEVAARAADVAAFEASALEAVGLDLPAVPPRYRSSYFNHIFGGGYSAGYYSYIWSEVLDADTVEWFRAQGGLMRAAGDRFRTALLSRGGTAPEVSYVHDVLGRAPSIAPLLRRRGLTTV